MSYGDDGGGASADDVVVLPPLPADPIFVEAVDDAVSGVAVENMPDAQLQRQLNVDGRDFASLYIRHRASFALHARRFLNDPRDVDEVLQEAFLRLFLAMPELDTELQALAYCRRTVTNLCIDRYRADQRRPRLVDLESMDYDPRDEASYDDPVLRAEDAAIVREALALLSPMHRAALVKREIEEKPLPQIAAELGIPEASVKHLLFRARRSLRRLLIGTSVEPGAELTRSDALRLANKRLAAGVVKGANVLIVMFVAAVTAVGAVRATTTGEGTEEAVAGPAQSVTHSGLSASTPRQVTLPRIRHARVTSRPPRASHVAAHHPQVVFTAPKPQRHVASSQPAATTRKNASRHHPVVGLPKVVQPLPASYKISAPSLGVTSAPAQVNTDAVELTPAGDWSNTSNFVAATPAGVFTLRQAVQQSSAGVVSANMNASVPLTTGQAADQTVTSTVSTSQTNGLVVVSVTLGVTPTATATQSDAPAPFTVHVAATYSANVTRVLDETVTVTEGSVPCCTSSTPSPNPPNGDTPTGVATPTGTGGSIGSAAVSTLMPPRRGDQLPLSSSLLVDNPAAVG